MKQAGVEVQSLKEHRESAGTEAVGCGVCCDGTWQRRGHSSRNGCVTVISMDTGTVLDVETFSQGWKKCELNEHVDTNSEEYQRWRADHTKYKANSKGFAP